MIKTDEEIDIEAGDDEIAKLLSDTKKLAQQRGATAAVIIFVNADGSTSRAIWSTSDEPLQRTVAWIDEFLEDTALDGY